MDSNRETKARFAKGSQIRRRTLTGRSLSGQPSSLLKQEGVAAPSSLIQTAPVSEIEPVEEWGDYTQHAKRQANAKLQNITGRLFQVLNDYENYQNEEEALQDLEEAQERNNIQSLITDYGNTVIEREDLLTSLAEWFGNDHMDYMLEDIQSKRRISEKSTSNGLRVSLMKGEQTLAHTLKAVNGKTLSAASKGQSKEQVKLQKDQLLVDDMEGVWEETNGKNKSTAAADVTNSNWKFVAVEICDMLHQVRDSGLEELQKMSDKIQELLSSMNQQTVVIDQLRAEADHQKQMALFSEQTTVKLSKDNSLLHKEVGLLQSQLLEAKHTISSLQADLQKMESRVEFENKRANAAIQKLAVSKNTIEAVSRTESTKSEKNNEAVVKNSTKSVAVSKRTRSEAISRKSIKSEAVSKKSTHADPVSKKINRSEDMLKSSNISETVPKNNTKVVPQNSNGAETIIPCFMISEDEDGNNEAQINKLYKDVATLTQERNELKLAMETYKKEFDDARQHFEAELEKCKYERDNLLKSAAHFDDCFMTNSTHSVMSTPVKLERSTPSRLEKLITQPLTDEQALATPMFYVNEYRKSLSAKKVEQLQIKLLDKRNQFEKARLSKERLQKEVLLLSKELQCILNESDTLRSQDKSTALIGQALSSLPVKREPSQINYPEMNHGDWLSKRPEANTIKDVVPTECQPTSSSYIDEPLSVVDKSEGSETEFWEVLCSLDGPGWETTYQECTVEEKEESVKLMVKPIDQKKVGFNGADSKALTYAHKELEKMHLVSKFSGNLINDEVESLKSHLPESELNNITTQTYSKRQSASMNVAEIKHFTQNKIKNDILGFLDQAIKVLEDTRMNPQKKGLQTVLDAMIDHKKRPNSHLRGQQSSSQRKQYEDLVGRLHKYARPHGTAVANHTHNTTASNGVAGFGTRRSLGSIGTITEPGSLLQIKPVAITNVESEETDYIVGNRKRPKQFNDYEMTASRERKEKAMASNGITFLDLLAHTDQAMRRHSCRVESQTLKLPPLAEV